MKKPSLFCIGPLPPVVHGQSEAFDTFVKSKLAIRAFDISVIDLNTVNMTLFKKVVFVMFKYLVFNILIPYNKPDAVYISFGRGKASFYRDCIFLRRVIKKKIPIIGHYHGGDMPLLIESSSEKQLKRIRYIFKEMARCIILSSNLADDVKDIINSKNLRVVANCFRLPSEFELNITKSSLSQDEEITEKNGKELKLLYLSNVNPDKGFFEVLECIAILKSMGCDIRLTFVGSFIEDSNNTVRDLEKRTYDLISDYSIGENVNIKGPLYGNEKWKEYLKADIFVLPTYYESEALPISILEAMAGGCCIITTAYRGIVDLIDDGVEGYFVESRNAKQLADKIEILCKDRKKMKLMKGAAKERAFKQFTEDKYIKGVIDVIKEVV